MIARTGLSMLLTSAAASALMLGTAAARAQTDSQPTTPAVEDTVNKGTGAVTAQSAPTTSEAPVSDGSGLGDIIVTAQKRATNIQSTPIALRAFDGDTIARSGVSDIAGLQRLAPDLALTTDTVFNKLTIRGVSSQDISEASDPALTVSVDGEYINRPVALNASFFDLERIEVLRGPQGTLYGRNSTAGAINIIAAKPKLNDFSGFAIASYGNYNAKVAQAGLNVPLGDTLAVRVAGLHNEHSGYSNNGAIGHGDNANTDAARAGVTFNPAPAVKLYVVGEYVNVNQRAPSQYGVAVSSTTPGVVDAIPSTPALEGGGTPAGVTFGDLPRSGFPLANLGLLKSTQYAVRGRADVDVGIGTVTYVGGYRDTKVRSVQPLNGFIPETFTFYNDNIHVKTQSHELRLSGGQEGRFIYQLGGFYFREHTDTARGLFLPLAAGGSFLNYFYRPLTSSSKAAFAQSSYWIVPDVLSVTGGIRYTDDKKVGNFTTFGPRFGRGFGRPAESDPTGVRTNPRQKSDQFTWTGGVEYKPARDNLLYAKVSRGYKAGGFDNVGAYSPEKLISYEVGSKNRFMNRKLEFNVTGFYYDYTDQQVQVFLSSATGAQTFNAGKSRIWGVETDTTILLSNYDRVSITANYLDTKFKNFPAVLPGLTDNISDIDPATPGIQAPNLRGNQAPQAPHVTIAIGYDKTIPIGDSKLVASVYTRFKSKYYLTAFNYAADREGDYTQTDISLRYVAPRDRFSIEGFVRNVENYRPITYAAFTGAGINLYNFIFGAPRTYGIQGSVKF